MSNQWTKDQQKVIDLRKRDLLVSAAAGSGKTAVLIERILGLLTDEEHPVDVDNLLVVTFTRAAAGEMRERLSAAIENRLSMEEENEHLVRQLTLIQNAQITTIDSFCSYVLKNYFHVIGLDPNYRVMDEGEEKLLKEEVIRRLLEEKYGEKTGRFQEFADSYAPGKNDEVLGGYLLKLYEFAMSYPYPEAWLKNCLRAYESESLEDFLRAPWMEELFQGLQRSLEDLEGQLLEALKIAGEADGPSMYQEAILSDLENLKNLTGMKNMWDLSRAFENMPAPARLSSKRDKQVKEEKKLWVKAIRDGVKEELKELQTQYFALPLEKQQEDMKACRGPAEVLVELTLEFMERFGEKKREKNLLDFHDMEHLTLSILLKEEKGEYVPTDTARELSSQFSEVMIDEYQDSNLVQEAILTAVSGKYQGEHNRFMVGDVKQSIYRFRLARPELFLEKYHAYTKEDSDSQRIDLSQNFRSRREVLAFTNLVFREIMGDSLGNLAYDEAAALYPGAHYPEGRTDFLKPELLFLDMDKAPELLQKTGETREELEARMTGLRILSMVGKEEVYDKERKALRKIEFRDVVILLRSPSSFAQSYLKVLKSMGIPAYMGTRSGYFSAREIQVMLSLLKIIDNPRQDIPLASVLASPIGGLTPKEMAEIKSEAGEDMTFEKACRWYEEEGGETGVKEKLARFYEKLYDFRDHVPYTPIHELLWYIFDKTGFETYVSAMPAGEQRSLNLKMLVQKAWDFEKTSYRGLFNFIRYIENLQEFDVDYGEASTLGEEENIVRIMSIHKSKGLEFPVVFLGGLEKQFNQQDTRSRLVLDVDLGAGCDLVDSKQRLRRPTLFKRWLQRKVKDDNLGEEIRVLYVALTRAKEKLVLTGAVKGLKKKAEEWYRGTDPFREGLSYRQLAGASGYLDLLMPVLFKWESAGDFLGVLGIQDKGFRKTEETVWSTGFSIHCLDVEDLYAQEMGQQVKEQLTASMLKNWDGEKIFDKSFREGLQERFQSTYPFADTSAVPAKLTVSELKRQSEELEEEGEILYEEEMPGDEGPEPILPEFLKEEKEIKGARKGTAYHTFLQYLDFGHCENVRQVEEQLHKLADSGRLTDLEARAIDLQKIQTLALSPLGKRLRKALEKGGLFREQQFVYAMPIKELYPETASDGDLLIQGVVDAYFEEEGELVLVDYKTDYVRLGEERKILEKYAGQLDYYAKALAQLTGQRVKEKILYSFWLQKELREN